MPDHFFAQPAGGGKRKRTGRPSDKARGSAGRSKGAPTSAGGGAKAKGKARARDEDDEVEGYSSDELGGGGGAFESDLDIQSDGDAAFTDEDDSETPAQKRLRLARAYLDGLKQDERGEGDFDARDIDRELISSRLQQDVLETTGKMHAFIAARLPATSAFRIFKTGRNQHRLPITCAVVSDDGRQLFAAGKEGSIVQYDISQVWRLGLAPDADPEGAVKRVAVLGRSVPRLEGKAGASHTRGKARAKAKAPGVSQATDAQQGHIGEVLSIAVSGDGKILASGGKDRLIGVWDISGEAPSWKKGLRGHKDTISSLTFRSGTSSLFSASYDRTLKIHDLASLAYLETLFGHQDKIHSIAALRGEIAVSAGGRDKTCRYWKVPDETQLVFRGGGPSKIRNLLEGGSFDDDNEQQRSIQEIQKKAKEGEKKFIEGSIDCVAMVDDATFLSGGDSGSICIWSTGKKKPIFTQPLAHGLHVFESASEGPVRTPRWITSLGCLPYGDLFASGSWDGSVRLWRIAEGGRTFSAIGDLAIPGVINSLQVLTHSMAESTDLTNGKASKKAKKTEVLGVVAGVGQEPRLGRWMRLKEVRNQVVVAVVPLSEPARDRTKAVNGFH